MGKKSAWLKKEWLHRWQEMSTSSRWHRGRTLFQHQQVKELRIAQGKIRGKVKGSDVYCQTITIPALDQEVLEKAKGAFLQNPALIMQVYQYQLDPENMEEEELAPLFSISPLGCHCTCPDEVLPCKHLIAVALSAGEEMEENPADYLLFRGLPWEELLSSLTSQTKDRDQDRTGTPYGMVPLPAEKGPIPQKKWTKSPPFWTSPFPFALIMEEIYAKVEEGEDSGED